MSTPETDMLRVLGGASRPAGLTGPSGAFGEVKGPNAADFASMLQRARRGEVASGLEVQVGKGVEIELSVQQREQLANLADRAEAAGVINLLVVMDGRTVTMDVGTRTITAVGEVSSGPIATGIDGVAFLSESSEEFVPLPLPATPGLNPFILSQGSPR